MRIAVIYLLSLYLSTVGIGLGGCQTPGPGSTLSASARPAPTGRFAGREPYVVTDDYVVYAKHRAVANELRVWLDEELAAFRSAYTGTCEGRGLVFAIEARGELPPVAEERRRQNLRPAGRRYLVLDVGVPHFIESFGIPPSDAIRLGLTPTSLRPTWACYLTTDRYSKREIRAKLREFKRTVRLVAKQGTLVDVWNFPAEILFKILREVSPWPKWRSIELELTHLQRRETLRRALLSCSVSDARERKRLLQELRDEVKGQCHS